MTQRDKRIQQQAHHATLSIGQVAKLYGISHDTLRLYDKKGLVKPIVNPETGYRSYTLEHLSILDMVMMGRKVGIPLAYMQECFTSKDITKHATLLHDQINAVRKQIQDLTQIEHSLTALYPLVEDMVHHPYGRTFVLEHDIYLEALYVDDLLSPDTLSANPYDRSEILLFEADSNGCFHENESKVFYPIDLQQNDDDCAEHTAPYTIEKRTQAHLFQGTMQAIRNQIMKLRTDAKQPQQSTFVQFDYCLPSPDLDHEYIVTLFV